MSEVPLFCGAFTLLSRFGGQYFRMEVGAFRVSGVGFRVAACGFQGVFSTFRVSGFGCRVLGCIFQVSGRLQYLKTLEGSLGVSPSIYHATVPTPRVRSFH